jgi:diguanylate cyclase (GGDEF)-like protein
MHQHILDGVERDDFAQFYMVNIRWRSISYQILGGFGATAFLLTVAHFQHTIPVWQIIGCALVIGLALMLQIRATRPLMYVCGQLMYISSYCLSMRLALYASPYQETFLIAAIIIASLIMATGFIFYLEVFLSLMIVLTILDPLPHLSSLPREALMHSIGFLVAGVVGSVLIFTFQSASLRRHFVLLQELSQQAYTDPLTGLPNRRAFFSASARRVKAGLVQPLYIAILDVDHFKQINDVFGHEAGDHVLCGLARIMQRALPGEIIARLGGEEFGIMLGSETPEAAVARLEQLLAGVRGDWFPSRTVTASIGVSPLARGQLDSALKRADDALYQAKRTGRDRVILSGMDG